MKSELPPEEDRKRFLGCLAVILAASYEYDAIEVNEKGGEVPNLQNGSDGESSNDDGLEKKGSEVEEKETDDSVSREFKKMTTFAGDLLFLKKKKKERRKRRQERCRQRRHEIACTLLLSSAEFLFLDISEAEASLPLLHNILSPCNKQVKSPPNLSSSDSEECVWDISEPWELVGDELIQDEAMKDSLEALSPGAGFRCLSLLLFQYLISCKDGYDSRVRNSLKRLGVAVIVHSKNDSEGGTGGGEGKKKEEYVTDSYSTLVKRATRKYESLERGIAARLLILAGNKSSANPDQDGSVIKYKQNSDEEKDGTSTQDQLIRGFKIGAVGVTAGTLLFLTGGAAAAVLLPALTNSLAVVGLGAAFTGITTAFGMLSLVATSSIFGVAGGSLAMYKMARRTEGLTEFSIYQEGLENNKAIEAELHRTICVSGWLRDEFDFQRPWGIQPSNPPLSKKREQLERFYAIYNPFLVPHSNKILKKWDKNENILWYLLDDKYKSNPDKLFPLNYGPRFNGSLEIEEERIIDIIVLEVGGRLCKNKKDDQMKNKGGRLYKNKKDDQMKNKGNKISKFLWKTIKNRKSKEGVEKAEEVRHVEGGEKNDASSSNKDSNNKGSMQEGKNQTKINLFLPPTPLPISDFEMVLSKNDTAGENSKNLMSKKQDHISTVWDFRAHYGGELYTVKWESKLLLDVNKTAHNLAVEFVDMAGKEFVKKTMLSTAAVASIACALPTVMTQIHNIDEEWVLIIDRANEAGKELAKCLLTNTKSGHRPVTLVGYSFGALVIYSCLIELGKRQEAWLESRKESLGDSDKNVLDALPPVGKKKEAGNSKKKEKDSDIEFDPEPASIIEDAFLMGLPEYLNLEGWVKCREIVSGRLVNVYCRTDKILTILFRYKNMMGILKPVCGTCTIAVPGVENIDVTPAINGNHDRYSLLIGDILEQIRFGQPLRSNWNAVDEMALIAETEKKIEDFN